MSCLGDCGHCQVPCEPPTTWAEYMAESLQDLCVEENGKCKCDPCRCNNGDTARPGW